ncbi:MAG TPA: GcrA family cell cycle regulator [Alphaproteobacteria bacterium]|jgi:GcrA cell cycle regulator|nr:gcrA cell cycle regulator family protein [Micavibrio sp.]MBK9562134.1 gcrA cell cycle regulator family protein [Micavibrio sp.]HQX27916.1 GcrA family cell cycle regulator [Alphaproteobacteria bacterium]
MSWTDERVALLKRLWGEGKTAAEIAGELGGVTRNAVIGKAHRLKLSNRVSPIQQNKKPVAVAKPSPEKKVRQTLEQDNNRTGVPMMDLGATMCRWPLGDPRDEKFSFCGDGIIPGLPYCESHSKAAYQAAGRARTLQAEDFEAAPKVEEPDEMQESKTAAKKR